MAGVQPPKALRAKYGQWKKIGDGGFGQVFKVTRPQDGKEFAIKILTMGNIPEVRERFHQEALLLKTLRHPNIVSIEEFSEDPTAACLYIVMEYCPGGDLQKALDIRRVLKQPMEEQQVLHIFLQILLGLHFCHTRSQEKGQILHRDLNPEDTTKTFKVADFGLAKMMGPHVQEATSVVGEIRRGEAYDKKLDGMGCLLFEISTLTSFPLRSDKILETIGQTLNAFTPGFRRMQALLLSPDPDLRPSTSDLLALPSIANLVNLAINSPLR
ncbi:kinase-like protein [Cystobasidium minutum MCA 4210]|uniref:kinase-like protein n=1 Tax=Cystobasidium minutum MCA 4210 TaxID=1397322 RepID=UPI0034CEC0FC|eukprot:jgi/Rhomi1/200742/MIX1571_84_46